LISLWHTNWNGCPQNEIWIQLDLGEVKPVSMVKYVSRTQGTNGIFEEYKVEVSSDGTTWTEVDKGTWESSPGSTEYSKFNTVQARYVKLFGLKTKTQETGKIFGSAAEIRVGYEDEGESLFLRAKAGTELVVTENEIQKVQVQTTVSGLKDMLEYSRGAEFNVLKADGGETANTDVVKSGMKAVLTRGQDTKNYTISVEKQYKEYAPDENMTATAKSQQSEDQSASKVLDGRTDTLWHTVWTGNIPQEDIWIQIDLGEVKPIAMVKYVARSSGGINGIFKRYKIEVSSDGTNWTEADSGTWSGEVGATEYAKFETVQARYVKLYGVETLVAAGGDAEAGKRFGTAAEIRIGYEATE